EIVRGSGGIEVHVIPGEHARPRPAEATAEPGKSDPWAYVWAGLVVVVSTLVCWGMFGRFDNSNLIMVYLLGVAFVATRLGRRPSALAAVLGVAAFDFFFVPPYRTFAVSDSQYIVTFAVMLVVGLLISTLAVRVRAQADAARRREQRTRVLYAMSRELARARTAEEVAAVAARHVSDALHGPAEALLPDGGGRLSLAGDAP